MGFCTLELQFKNSGEMERNFVTETMVLIFNM